MVATTGLGIGSVCYSPQWMSEIIKSGVYTTKIPSGDSTENIEIWQILLNPRFWSICTIRCVGYTLVGLLNITGIDMARTV